MMGAAGASGGETYVDDVFSTYLYNGNSGANQIVNGIDNTEGGLVWFKNRIRDIDHALVDTESGSGKYLRSNSSSVYTYADNINTFNNNGFTLQGGHDTVNSNWQGEYSSWNFRKAPGFFDIVTYTGNDTNRTIAHSLGSIPGMILIKGVDAAHHWQVYHRGVGNTKVLKLNDTDNASTSGTAWNNTSPTDTHFSLGTEGGLNTNGGEFIAYLFAHNNGDGEFGETGDKDIIKCGSYVGSGSAGLEVNVGFEPQWVLVKNASASQYWMLSDSMRGIVTGANDALLYPNASDAEDSTDRFSVTPTGFKVTADADVNGNGNTMVYVAIRRPDGYVGKPVEVGSNVFVPTLGNGSATIPSLPSTFPVDFCLYKDFATTANWATTARLTGGAYMKTNLTDAEASTNEHAWDSMVGCHAGTWLSSNDIGYLWKRNAGFDVVTYTGDDAASKDIAHSLGKTPEMIWIKCRNDTAQWVVGHKGMNGGVNPWNYFIALNSNGADEDNTMFNDTPPTSTHFTVGTDNDVNDTDNYIAMLFASVEGVSKVGYYNGSSYTQTITTGFQPRFVILRNIGGGYWFVLDTTRGWGPGNDAYIWLDGTNAQLTDHDFGAPTSTGFTLNSFASYNGAGEKYIYYAHA